MKLIIDISEEDYEWVCEQNMGFELYKMIANGTPLTESDDCVSREAVIETLKDVCDEYEVFLIGVCGQLPIKCVKAIYSLPSVQPKREKHDEEIIKETVESIWGKPPYPYSDWIPVTERLPKDDVKVLITTDEGETETAHRSTQAWTDDEYEWVIYATFGYKNSLLDDEVIAWMPLPEPYKAESEVRND